MSGNTLGPTVLAAYEPDDGGDLWLVRIPAAYNIAEFGFGGSITGAKPKPKRSKMRFIWVQEHGVTDKPARKRVHCGTPTCDAYTFAEASTTIDSVVFDIMSRHGEKVVAGG
jgi:hypothetical protein